MSNEILKRFTVWDCIVLIASSLLILFSIYGLILVWDFMPGAAIIPLVLGFLSFYSKLKKLNSSSLK